MVPAEPGGAGGQAGPGPGGSAAGVLALLEQQILAAVIAVVSGPGGKIIRSHSPPLRE